MEERNLLKVSIAISLVGILLILFVSEKMTLPISKISSIDKSFLDKDVKVKGLITSIREFPGLFILSIKDETGEITVVVFKEEEIILKENKLVEIEGQVVEYKGQIEINAKTIKVF